MRTFRFGTDLREQRGLGPLAKVSSLNPVTWEDAPNDCQNVIEAQRHKRKEKPAGKIVLKKKKKNQYLGTIEAWNLSDESESVEENGEK